MKKETIAILLGASLCAAGCGTEATTANAASTGQGPTILPPPPAATRSLAGSWQGTLKGTQDLVFLNLVQTGTAVDGDGALFVNNRPTAVEVSGNIDAQGQAVLDLVPHDENNSDEGLELDLTLISNDQADANLSNTTTPAGLDVALQRTGGAALKLWNNQTTGAQDEAYRIDARGASQTFLLDVVLNQGQHGFTGRWTLGAGSSPMLLGTTGGVVLAGNVGTSSYMTFLDSNGQISFGNVWFVTMSDGIAGSQSAILTTSRLNGQQLTGTTTLVRP